MEIVHQFEPTDLQCGQAVLGMICGIAADDVCRELDNSRETTLAEMRSFLSAHGFTVSRDRKSVSESGELPSLALLSLETPICWHWSLYFDGVFYDPQYGILTDWPPSNRRYCWSIG